MRVKVTLDLYPVGTCDESAGDAIDELCAAISRGGMSTVWEFNDYEVILDDEE